MNEQLKYAQKIIKERFNEEDNNYGLLVLSCYGLLKKFGEKYADIVRIVFLETEFFIDNKCLNELLINACFNPNDIYGIDIDDDLKINNLQDEIVAISFQGDQVYFSNDNKLLHEKSIPALFCSTLIKNTEGENVYNVLLNMLVHELAHLVKSKINTIQTDEINYFDIRNGLSFLEYTISNDEVLTKQSNLILDEAINVLQVSDILTEIGKLKSIELEGDVLDFFNKLEIDTLDKPLGYELPTILVQQLWENEYFKNSIEDNIVEGNIDTIVDNFNQVMGSDVFNNFSFLLDVIDEEISDTLLIDKTIQLIYEITDVYNKKTEKTDKVKKLDF